MTIIKQTLINSFRNLGEVNLQFSNSYNYIYGCNGSGKTSILEALYMLANGKSFRSSVKTHIIQHHKDKFTVFAKLEADGQEYRCGLEKSVKENARLHINGERCRSIAKASEILPIILIDPHSYDLIEEGPSYRRHYMDWLLFHVKHDYRQIAQEYAKCLKQRNAALKQQLPKQVCQTWDPQLIELATTIDGYRKELLDNLQPFYQEMVAKLQFPVEVNLSYYQGWDKSSDFASGLLASFYKDQAIGYTAVGPQRADIKLMVEDIPASDVLSRGQSKLAIAALLLAQGSYYQSLMSNAPIYFVDDLASELDQQNRQNLYGLLADVEGQMFVTATEKELFPKSGPEAVTEAENYLFHVKQGEIVT